MSRPVELQLDEKWDKAVDVTLRRTVYSSLAGLAGGLLLFRTPAGRLSAISFGAGLGLGSAYTEASHIFNGKIPLWSPSTQRDS